MFRPGLIFFSIVKPISLVEKMKIRPKRLVGFCLVRFNMKFRLEFIIVFRVYADEIFSNIIHCLGEDEI